MDTPAAGNPIATAAPPREEVLAGMACVDTSGNPRIPMLMEMVGALSRAREPADVLRTFGQNHWYNFNVADSAIVVGAGVLLTDALLQLRRKPATPEQGAAGPGD